MRFLILALGLAMALPAVTPTAALAQSDTCSQLRQTVLGRMPANLRDRPWSQISCAGIAELHVLVNVRSANDNRLQQRVDAVFRGEELLR